MASSKKWHPAEQQPCLTCKRWIPLEIPIHFLGSGYECNECYSKRNNKQQQSEQPKQATTEEKGRLCAECGNPDYTYIHEVKTWTYTLIPVTMYLTADRKLICQRCVTDARLKEWWINEMSKPRQPHPQYYLKHDPLSKVCTCDLCNDPNRPRTTKSTGNKTNRHFSNSKRTA